jgi:hypothetical protein
MIVMMITMIMMMMKSAIEGIYSDDDQPSDESIVDIETMQIITIFIIMISFSFNP